MGNSAAMFFIQSVLFFPKQGPGKGKAFSLEFVFHHTSIAVDAQIQ